MTRKQLAVFTIGPVQSFIAASRNLNDLWSGSYLLSHLIEFAIDSCKEDYGDSVQFIFPVKPEKDAAPDIASLPNRMTMTIAGDSERAAGILRNLEKKLTNYFQTLCLTIVKDFYCGDKNRFPKIICRAKQQTRNFLEIYWAFASLDEGHFTEVREQVETTIAGIKNDRQFAAMHEDGRTCTVCGLRSSLTTNSHDWKKRGSQIKDNEYLCAICLTKRKARDYFYRKVHMTIPTAFKPFGEIKNIGNEDDAYIGVLLMDGDGMGAWFHQKQSQDDYRHSSRVLSQYAQDVNGVITKNNGKLIYAGGDDTLAILPIKNLFSTALTLRKLFRRRLGKSVTASAGIVIGHKKAPLDELIADVREQERVAKSFSYKNGEKNAVAIRARTHSGNVVETTMPWLIKKDVNSVALLLELVELLSVKAVSKTFIYHLSDTFKAMLDLKMKQVDKELFFTEFKRLAKRSLAESVSKQKEAELIGHIKDLGDLYEMEKSAGSCLTQFIDLLKIAALVNRKEELEDA
jgi:CRISPR-associated protein Cmr2